MRALASVGSWQVPTGDRWRRGCAFGRWSGARGRRGASLLIQEFANLIDEASPCRFVLQQQMIAALKGDESCLGDGTRQRQAVFECDQSVVAAGQTQGRYRYLRRQGCHVDVPEYALQPHGVLRRGRYALQVVEPLHLLERRAGNEQRREDLSERGVVLPRALAHQRLHPLALRACFRRTALAP